MLTSIRERATGWIAWTIVILITIPFALWGINSYFTDGVNVNVAQFDGEVIDYQTYQRAIFSERDRLRQQYGNNVSAEFLSGDVLGRQVVNRLVNDVLLQRDAQEKGFRVTDAQLAETIFSEPEFQDEQGFSRERYDRLLQFSGFSPAEFEALQRASAATQQLQTGFVESVLQIDSSVEDLTQLLTQRRLGEYVIVEPSAFLSEVQVTDEEIRKEYEDNQMRYEDDEKVKVQYIELSRDDFAVGFTPTDETLRELYDAEMQQFLEEEQRNVRHILLETEEDDNSAAMERANELVTRLKDGEDFATLAAEYSTDVGSAEQGGSIGWINRGATVPAFESVAFSLTPGEISEPVVSEFGIHIIQVEEIQDEKIKEFEEVRDELIEQAVRTQAESEMFEMAEELRNVAFEQPDSLAPASDLLGIEIQESDWFSRMDGTGIASNRRVREIAFGETVLEEGFNSDVISLDDGRHVLLRKQDHRPTQILSLDLVEDEIKERLLSEKSSQQAQERVSMLLEQLEDGADWMATISEYGYEPQGIPGRTGNDANLGSTEVAAYIYAWEKPGENTTAVYGSGSLSDGRQTLFRITGVANDDGETGSEQELEELRNTMNLRFGAGLFESYLNQLRDGIEVSINDELL